MSSLLSERDRRSVGVIIIIAFTKHTVVSSLRVYSK